MNKLALFSLVVAVAACSDDAPKGTVNTANAKASVEQLAKLNSSMHDGNGAAAASAVQALTSAGQGMVAPAGQAQRQIGILPESFPRPDVSKAISGTATCNESGCTFDNYGDDSAGSSWSINGSVTKTGDTTSFNLTYKVASGGTTVDWSIDGDVTVTATLVDGNVHSHGVTDVAAGSNNPGVSVTWDTAVDYNNITLDAQGCAVGGDVHAAVSYSAKSGGNGGSFSVQGGAKFGPGCGQVVAD